MQMGSFYEPRSDGYFRPIEFYDFVYWFTRDIVFRDIDPAPTQKLLSSGHFIIDTA